MGSRLRAIFEIKIAKQVADRAIYPSAFWVEVFSRKGNVKMRVVGRFREKAEQIESGIKKEVRYG